MSPHVFAGPDDWQAVYAWQSQVGRWFDPFFLFQFVKLCVFIWLLGTREATKRLKNKFKRINHFIKKNKIRSERLYLYTNQSWVFLLFPVDPDFGKTKEDDFLMAFKLFTFNFFKYIYFINVSWPNITRPACSYKYYIYIYSLYTRFFNFFSFLSTWRRLTMSMYFQNFFFLVEIYFESCNPLLF